MANNNIKINSLIVENTASQDIAKVEVGFDKILYRIFTESLASNVCSTIKVQSTKGKLFAFGSFYERNYADVDKSTQPFGAIESDYSGDREHSQEGDVKASLRNKLLGREFDCFTKNIKSVWTMEAMQDFTAVADPDKSSDILEQELATEIIQEMDKGLIEFCMKEGTKNTLTIDASTDYNRLLGEIQKYGIQMTTAMKRPPCLKVIASAYICGLLASHPQFDSSKVDFTKNIYYFGRIHNVEIYCDALGVASDIGEDFAIILYKTEGDRPASSLTYVQYKEGYSFYSAVDSKTGELSYFHGNRYDIIKHPLDDGTTGASKFITYLSIPKRQYP